MKTEAEIKNELLQLKEMSGDPQYQMLDGPYIYAKIVALEWVLGSLKPSV